MTHRLPAFLVIGAKKAGTTWLDGQLRAHRDICMPMLRKEIAYFDCHYERGNEWYSRWFAAAPRGALIGESTPEYLHDQRAAGRILADLPAVRLIVSVREPIARAHSEWAHERMKRGVAQGFLEWVRENPRVLDKSRYAQQLARFADARGDGRLMVLVFEEAILDPEAARRELAAFLQIDPARFGPASGINRNESYTPAWRGAHHLLTRIANWLRRRGFDRTVNLAIGLGAKRLTGRSGPVPPLSASDRLALRDLATRETRAMEEYLGRPIPAWSVDEASEPSEPNAMPVPSTRCGCSS